MVTVKLPAWPGPRRSCWSALVIAGASLTVRVKVWVASLGSKPLLAVMVKV